MTDLSNTAAPTEPPSEANFRLLQQVKAGDEQAAVLLVESHYELVRRIVLAHLPRRDDPEDLMQEIFLKVFSRLEQYRMQVPFENWVARVALSTCFDRLRHQQRRPELRWADLSPEEKQVIESFSEEEPTGSPECARELLERLIAGLKPEERLLIRCLDLEGQTIKDVCALTGWSSGVTRIRAFRARQKLKAAFKKLDKRSSHATR